MTSTSCEEIARGVLADCLAGNPPDRLPRELLQDECARALFGVVVEGLADRFDPELSETYARLFAPVFPSADLARYRRIARVRPVNCEVRRVLVPSRVTLGADIAVTSVVLDAAKRRFPEAEIVFAGPRKNYELFAGDARVRHEAIEYRRGTIAERLGAAAEFAAMADGLVLDPDSRITQLGLVPAGMEECYHLFESRSYGAETSLGLPELAARWAAETLGVRDARPYLAVQGSRRPEGRYAAISLGVGGNGAKMLADPFEGEFLKMLAARYPLVVDRGAGGEERDRVERAVAQAGVAVTYWDGSFAGFAAIIAGAALYAGYDSAGQHAAAASGVPLITVFAGFPTERMFQRWRPSGNGVHVVRCDSPDPGRALGGVREVLDSL